MKKIWQKTESNLNNSLIEEYTVWIDYLLDMELLPYDIQWSKAHVKMLNKIWVLTLDEKDSLLLWLENIIDLYSSWEFVIEKHQEDWHTAIESYLTDKLWEVWKKIHTGRSRNDQILITTRLYTLDKLENIINSVNKLINTFESKIWEIWNNVMPWYTHTQKAMPTTIWVWLWSIKESLKDDLILVNAAKLLNNQNPLWSVAWFGEDVFWLDRDYVTSELWILKNSRKSNVLCI